ncbi:patatin-like protein [Reyranella sp.]|uniref:patatin-like protein n=1 Tax=Reyranella sp. TaxID=1929291 RepID=UPI003D0AB433
MREKELRIALVCFGGASLAIYMHGTTKEILKLVRASSALHAIQNRSERAKASFFDKFDPADPEYDTEGAYFDLLRDVGRTVELRVVVDIIAGASAGGINAAMLARALSHDLPMGSLRDLWLDGADIGELLAPEARAGAWSKWFLKPAVWALGKTTAGRSVVDPELRRNLSLFVRSRWFKPPLSGAHMAELLYDALAAMGPPRDRLASLLPSGHTLDLFITLTDHYGYEQLVRIHQPPLIHEREHRHVLRFHYGRRPNGDVESDFDLPGVPGLAFAARATSSFPGMFPPARIVEMDSMLARKGIHWTGRADFISHNFAPYIRLNVDPTAAHFIDGGVLNNRPFRQAISAIRGRPAHRQVDRRLVYVDADPAGKGAPARHSEPGFFTMLKGALSDLPSTQPVTDELNWVDAFNDRIDRLREIIEEARPRVVHLVSSIVTVPFDAYLTAAQVGVWRKEANLRAARDAGFAYEGYVGLKLASARTFVSGLIADLRGVPHRSPLGYTIASIVDAWAAATGRHYDGRGEPPARSDAASAGVPPARWVGFLRAFDIDYARRRLHFLIEGQNRLYQMLDQPPFEGFDPTAVDKLKGAFYDCLGRLEHRVGALSDESEIRDLVERLFPAAPPVSSTEDDRRRARQFTERYHDELDLLIERLAGAINLEACSTDIDTLLAETDPSQWNVHARRDIFVSYLGFSFWDVLTFPMMTGHESGEFNRILVDRLSPEDARSLGNFSGSASLRGVGFRHFAAFFSRTYRENDYLLGRLHAFDRLVDIVCDSAGIDVHRRDSPAWAWKKKGFRTILDAEESHLPNSAALVAALRKSVDEL